MRKDMSKVIVERARIKVRSAVKGRKHRHKDDILDLPAKVSMKKSAGWGRKSLNENLSPLQRFLNSRVNRKWDKVYSEICENLKPTSAVQQHVRDHLKDFVEINPFFDGKKVFYSDWRAHELWDGALYVDLKGFLRKYKHRRVKKPAPENPLQRSLNNLLALIDCKILFEQDSVFTLLRDRETSEWRSRVLANKTHARIQSSKVIRKVDTSMIAEFLRLHTDLKKSRNEYLASLYRNLEKGLEELETRKPD